MLSFQSKIILAPNRSSDLPTNPEETLMNSMMMLQAATALFLLAAVGGLGMAGIRFAGNRNPPAWLAMAHGLLAGAGLTLLVYAALASSIPFSAKAAAALFILAALGGVFLNLAYHQKGLPIPKGIVILHAVLAVLAFVLLLTAVFT